MAVFVGSAFAVPAEIRGAFDHQIRPILLEAIHALSAANAGLSRRAGHRDAVIDWPITTRRALAHVLLDRGQSPIISPGHLGIEAPCADDRDREYDKRLHDCTFRRRVLITASVDGPRQHGLMHPAGHMKRPPGGRRG